MDKNSFSLLSPGVRRRASTAVPVERPWNPPQRQIFSSREQRSNHANMEAFADFVDSTEDPPAYLRDVPRMNRSFSSPQFDELHVAREEGPNTEMNEEASLHRSRTGSGDNESLEEKLTDEIASQGRRRRDDNLSSQDAPSFTSVQAFIDSLWVLNRAPEKLQDFFDGMKEEINNRASELSTEKRTSARLSQEVESLQRELKASREKEKQREIKISDQNKVLEVESEKCCRLREENEELQSILREDRRTFEKALNDKKGELDKISRDHEAAKADIELKEKANNQVRGEVTRLEQKNEDEVKRRETAEVESQVFKRDIFELRKRSNEEKRNWLASQKENEAKLRKLEELNCALTEKVATLEKAVQNEKEANQVVETDLQSVLSFLRSICYLARQVYLEFCLPGRQSLSEIICLPDSVCLTINEPCKGYEVFEQLFQALDASPSATSIRELTSPYKEAITRLFETILLRDLTQSQFVSSSHDAFKRLESTHEEIKECFRKEWHRLRELSVHLSSELVILKRESTKFNEVFARQARKTEEGMKKQEELKILQGRYAAVKDRLKTCKRLFALETEKLLRSKNMLCTDYQDFKHRVSKNVSERISLYKVKLEKAEQTIKNLDFAASMSTRKLKEMEDSLPVEIDRLRTLLSQRVAQVKELSRSEADLRKTKDELVCSSRELAADGEKHIEHITQLNLDMEKLVAEKDDALKKVTEAQHAIQQMSTTVAEALSAKQNALEAFIREKSTVEQLRSELAKVCDARSLLSDAQKPAPQEEMPKMLHKDVGHQPEDSGTDVDVVKRLAAKVGSHKQQNEGLRSSPTSQYASSPLRPEENQESDLCDLELIPKRTKRRPSAQKPRRSPRQKRARSNSTKIAAGAAGPSARDLKPKLVSQASMPPRDVKSQSPSTSATARDEEWDIDVIIGNNER